MTDKDYHYLDDCPHCGAEIDMSRLYSGFYCPECGEWINQRLMEGDYE